ncbi:unnamed protein product, partial [Rotaria socialis]
AKSVAEPFAFAEYRKQKLRAKIDLKREKSRVPLPIVPTVNKELAEKLLHDEGDFIVNKKKKQKAADTKESLTILKDSRFRSLFTNPDMQIDANHVSFKNIAPLVSRLSRQTTAEDESISNENDEDQDEEEQEDDDGNDLIDDMLTSDDDN